MAVLHCVPLLRMTVRLGAAAADCRQQGDSATLTLPKKFGACLVSYIVKARIDNGWSPMQRAYASIEQATNYCAWARTFDLFAWVEDEHGAVIIEERQPIRWEV